MQGEKIFYFMHIPWGWIKQRPHFIALHLNKFYPLDIYLPKFYTSKDYTKVELKLSWLFRFPYERNRIIGKINYHLLRYQIKNLIKKYKFIWITDLRLFVYLKDLLSPSHFLIYDCMDDTLEFNALTFKNFFKEIEKELYSRSDIVFFSSNQLGSRKKRRYKIKNYKIVPNALDKKLITYPLYQKYDEFFKRYENYTILTYIGTISNWFNEDIILKSLQEYEDIIYFLVGPTEKRRIKHPRVIYFGGLEHKFLKTFIVKSDIMILPFRITPLVEVVDPVKLYEYIAFNKKILSIYYPELQKFKPYVNFYTNYKEYSSQLRRLKAIKSRSILINKNFIEENCWEKRVKEIVTFLEKVSHDKCFTK